MRGQLWALSRWLAALTGANVNGMNLFETALIGFTSGLLSSVGVFLALWRKR